MYEVLVGKYWGYIKILSKKAIIPQTKTGVLLIE